MRPLITNVHSQQSCNSLDEVLKDEIRITRVSERYGTFGTKASLDAEHYSSFLKHGDAKVGGAPSWPSKVVPFVQGMKDVPSYTCRAEYERRKPVGKDNQVRLGRKLPAY